MNIERHSQGIRVKLIDTPTGPLSVIRPVAEKLLKEGVISGDIDGTLTAQDAVTVKAAIIGNAVCDFCSSPGVVEDFNVPDFNMPSHEITGLESTGGWAACETCADLVKRDRRKDLLNRSVETAAFPKFSKLAIKELHDKFWRAMDDMVDVTATAKAVADTLAGTIPEDIDRQFPNRLPTIPKSIRREAVKREFGFTDEEVDHVMVGQVSSAMAKKLLDWKQAGKSALLPHLAKPFPPTPPDLIPHWQKALDAKFSAYSSLKEKVAEAAKPDARGYPQAQKMRELLNMGFADDVKWLRDADTYSFNAETIAAIREASQYVPLDTPLHAVDLPSSGSGWFYFAEPLPIIASSLVSEKVHALLWGWEQIESSEITFTLDDDWLAKLGPHVQERFATLMRHDDTFSYTVTRKDLGWLGMALRDAGMTETDFEACCERHVVPEADPALVFSAYVIDERGQYLRAGSVSPSTRFYWRFSNTIAECLDKNGKSWDVSYGPGADREGQPQVVGRAETLHTVEQLIRFFATACSWFKQRVPVLTREPATVERHARKRLMKEHKLAAPPNVNIVALRKSERVAREDAPGERQEGAREYSCRWIVRRHPRLQPYGPGRSQKKLIWIEAHPAGPDDKPLRTRETVYAVIR